MNQLYFILQPHLLLFNLKSGRSCLLVLLIWIAMILIMKTAASMNNIVTVMWMAKWSLSLIKSTRQLIIK